MALNLWLNTNSMTSFTQNNDLYRICVPSCVSFYLNYGNHAKFQNRHIGYSHNLASNALSPILVIELDHNFYVSLNSGHPGATNEPQGVV